MKIRKCANGDISIEFKKFIVWFYPHRHMNISHMKPKTLIKGFLYKSEYYGTSYNILEASTSFLNNKTIWNKEKRIWR